MGRRYSSVFYIAGIHLSPIGYLAMLLGLRLVLMTLFLPIFLFLLHLVSAVDSALTVFGGRDSWFVSSLLLGFWVYYRPHLCHCKISSVYRVGAFGFCYGLGFSCLLWLLLKFRCVAQAAASILTVMGGLALAYLAVFVLLWGPWVQSATRILPVGFLISGRSSLAHQLSYPAAPWLERVLFSGGSLLPLSAISSTCSLFITLIDWASVPSSWFT